jgi:hypothetical protein
MAEKKLPKIYRRQWLNKDEGSGYIIIEAEVERHWNAEKHPEARHLSANVEIKDCNRQINLDFWANDEKEYKQRLKKMRQLIETLEEFEKFLIENPVVDKTKAKKKKKKVSKTPATIVEATATLRPTSVLPNDEK